MSAVTEQLVEVIDQNTTVIRNAFDELQRVEDQQACDELENMIVCSVVEAGTALVQLLARVLARYARA